MTNEKPNVRIAAARGKKRDDLDEQIKELKDEGFDFTPSGKNRAHIGKKKSNRAHGETHTLLLILKNNNVSNPFAAHFKNKRILLWINP